MRFTLTKLSFMFLFYPYFIQHHISNNNDNNRVIFDIPYLLFWIQISTFPTLFTFSHSYYFISNSTHFLFHPLLSNFVLHFSNQSFNFILSNLMKWFFFFAESSKLFGYNLYTLPISYSYFFLIYMVALFLISYIQSLASILCTIFSSTSPVCSYSIIKFAWLL
jgi:hypothetical protein